MLIFWGHLVFARHRPKCFLCIYLDVTTTWWYKCSHFSFTDEESEIQKREVTCTADKWSGGSQEFQAATWADLPFPHSFISLCPTQPPFSLDFHPLGLIRLQPCLFSSSFVSLTGTLIATSRPWLESHSPDIWHSLVTPPPIGDLHHTVLSAACRSIISHCNQ